MNARDKAQIGFRATPEQVALVESVVRKHRTSVQQLFEAYLEYLAEGNIPVGYPGWEEQVSKKILRA